MIRKSGLVFLLILTGIVLFIMYWFTDYWFERKIEKTATELNGALVELDNFHFSIFNLNVKWDRLQVTDTENTMRNLFETERTEFKMEFFPLLFGNFVIDNLEMSGIKTDTERKYSGAVPWLEKKRKNEKNSFNNTLGDIQERLENQIGFDFASVPGKLNVDSVIALLEVKSPEKIENLKNSVESDYKTISGQFNFDYWKLEGEKLEGKIRSIKTENITDPTNVITALTKVNEIKTDLELIEDSLANLKRNVTESVTSFSDSLQNIDDWIKEDYERALSKAKLPEINAESIAKILFGENLIRKVNKYIGYVEKARYYADKYGGSDPNKEPDPPRFKGQDIYFPNSYARPKFWLKQVKINGETPSQLRFSGLINNISTNQKLTGKPIELSVSGKNEINTTLQISGLMNYTTDTAQEDFNVIYEGFVIENVNLSESKLLPNKLKQGRGYLKAKLNMTDNYLETGIGFEVKNMELLSESTLELSFIEQTIQSTLSDLNELTVNSTIKGTKNNLSFELDSNIDDLLSQKLNSLLSEGINQTKQEINKFIESRTSDIKQQAFQFVNSKKAELESKITELNNQADNLNKLIEQKKIELDNHKKQLEDQLKNKLKGIFG